MKIKNKIIGILIAFTLISANVGFTQNNISYASSTETDIEDKREIQKNELQKAVDDSISVVNSEVYFSYTSQPLKSEYESAIEQGQLELSREDATFLDFRDATLRIINAKEAIYNEASKIVEKIKTKRLLEQSIINNKIIVEAARNLINNYPKTVRNVKTQLLQMIDESLALQNEAQALLETL